MVQLHKFSFNPLGVNTTLLFDDSGSCVVIDPACYSDAESNELLDFIRSRKLRVDFVANTHGHFDHLFGVASVVETFGCPFMIHAGDAALVDAAGSQAAYFGLDMHNGFPAVKQFFSDGDILSAGEVVMRVIHVPGHSPGGVAFYLESLGLLVAGDILFRHSIGRTDLPGGDHSLLISGIRNKLFILPDDTRVIAGHGEDTTIGDEKKHNPFLRA